MSNIIPATVSRNSPSPWPPIIYVDLDHFLILQEESEKQDQMNAILI